MSFLDSLKKAFGLKNDRAVYLQGFQKSKSVFGDQLKGMEKDFDGINDDFLEQLTIVLLESDIGIDIADMICERLKKMSEDYPKVSFDWAMGFLLQIMKELYEEIPDDPEVAELFSCAYVRIESIVFLLLCLSFIVPFIAR